VDFQIRVAEAALADFEEILAILKFADMLRGGADVSSRDALVRVGPWFDFPEHTQERRPDEGVRRGPGGPPDFAT